MSSLEHGNSKVKDRASQIFRIIFVFAAPQSLTTTEMKQMLALRPGHAIHKADIIEDLDKCLYAICGALVDVLADSTVSFIHLSVREYLTSDEVSIHHPRFHTDRCSAHARSADLCLSYLLYDAPTGPLSGFADQCPASLCISFPLLRYSFHWTLHAEESLQRSTHGMTSHCWRELETRITTFLGQRLTVTTWIEGLWLFNFQHGLESLLSVF
jgi:hypothetical protein